MKKNITNKAKKRHYLFSLVLLVLGYNVSFSQAMTKEFVKEINVATGSKINVEGPGNLPFQSEGSLKVNTSNGYTLEPRDNKGFPAFVANKLDVETSKDNALKQIVTVKVVPIENSKNDAKALLEAIIINISKNGNQYNIDNNLNIQRLSFKNGFFSGTQNIVVLSNGSTYNVRSIEISAKVIVPNDTELLVNSKYIDVAIEDFNGLLDINADKSKVQLNNVTNLNARFNSCKVSFKSVNTATIVAYNSTIDGNEVNHLDLGTEELILKESLFENTKKASLSTYTINKVETLNILETSNDEFIMGEVGEMDVKSSHFSNYKIQKLKNKLFLKAKNGNIEIDSILKDFTSLTIDNQISTINLGVQELENYTVRFPKLDYTEKSIPESLKEVFKGNNIAFSKGKIKDKGIISISCKNCKIDIKD